MKKKILLIVIYFSIFVTIYGQEYNITDGIVLNQQNEGASITITFQDETPINSAWDRGKVLRYSNNPNNETKLGKFVEMEYEMGYEFEGFFMSQGKMIIIFSNLSEINVTEKTIISKGTLICKTKKGGGNDLRVFILSKTDNLRFLQLWTNNKKVKIGNYWYWDPTFLFK